MPQISIIIPVYNSERYIRKCVHSIVEQNINDIEIIIVDDGSTDNTANICDELISFDDRINVIHVENGGVSRARNIGLSMSTGEWVYFVDSDDFLCENALSLLIEKYDLENVDIVKFGFNIVYITQKKIDSFKVDNSILIKDKSKAYSIIETSAYCGFLWNTLFRRELILGLSFKEDLYWLEDHVFTYNALSIADTILIVPHRIYNYVVRDEPSLSKRTDPIMKILASNAELKAKQMIADVNSAVYAKSVTIYHERIESALNEIYLKQNIFQRYNSLKMINLVESNTIFPLESIIFSHNSFLIRELAFFKYRAVHLFVHKFVNKHPYVFRCVNKLLWVLSKLFVLLLFVQTNNTFIE